MAALTWPLDMAAYYEDVEQRYGAATEDFVRAYVVPGMAHCAGGLATDRFDSFGELQRWTEQGIQADEIVGTAGDDTPWPGRTRPLCPYPTEAVYDGVGDPEVASSFTCQ